MKIVSLNIVMKMHKHHIVPKHMDGSNDPSNLIELTVEDHAEAHRVLFEQHGRLEDYYAWKGLSGTISKAEIMRNLQSYYGSLPKSELHKARIRSSNKAVDWSFRLGKGNPMYGKNHTKEALDKFSKLRIGKAFCRWVTNGVNNKYILKNLPTPDGWRNGRTLKRNTDGTVRRTA